MEARKIIPISSMASYRCELSLFVTMLASTSRFAHAVSVGLTPADFMDDGLRFMVEIAYEQFQQRGHADSVTLQSEIIERDDLERAGGMNGAYGGLDEPINTLAFNDNLERVIASSRIRAFHDRFYNVKRRVFDDLGISLREREKRMHEGLNALMLSMGEDYISLIDAQGFAELSRQNYRDALSGNRIIFQPSGILSLDERTGGTKQGRVTMIAARPSHGKTAFATWFAIKSNEHWRRKNEPGQVLYFSAEMDEDAMSDRVISALSGVEADAIASGKLTSSEREKVERALDRLGSEIKISIDTHSSPTTAHIMGRALAQNASEPVRLIVFDYLEYTGEGGSSKDIRLENALRGLHEVAKRIDCPVLCLSQLNRDLEKRGDAARPQLGDMRYTGAAENIAGMVLMLYHPWTHWHQRGNDPDKSAYEEPDERRYEVFIRKNTQGRLGGFHLDFERRIASFSDPLESSKNSKQLVAPF